MLGLAQRSDLSCDLSCANKSMTEPEIHLTNLALFLAMFIEVLSLTTQRFQCFRKTRPFSERKKKKMIYLHSLSQEDTYMNPLLVWQPNEAFNQIGDFLNITKNVFVPSVNEFV